MARQTSKIPLLTKKTHKNPSISKMNHMQKKIHSASTYIMIQDKNPARQILRQKKS
jgi:hypothetical protein